MKKKLLYSLFFIGFFLVGVCIFPLAEAYIPTYSMILSHLADSQGRGAYRIEQEVLFKQGTEPISLKEIWWVTGSGQMRLDVSMVQKKIDLSKFVPLEKTQRQPANFNRNSRPDFYLRFIYQGGKKIFRDENNELQKQPLSHYHLEQPFHLRKGQKLKKLFSIWKVAPFQVPERQENQGSDSFVRLIRKGGIVQYQIGQGPARLWLEQDEFVIRFWKWSSGESLQAGEYKLYPGNLFFPSHRIFRQTSMEVWIQTRKVQSLKVDKKWIHTKRLSKKNILPLSLSSADQDRIREFYKKFR